MDQVLGVMLTVSDLEKMRAFFTTLLGCQDLGTSDLDGELFGMPGADAQLAILKLGEQHVYLLAFDQPGKPYPPTRGNDHLFQHMAIVVSDLEEAHDLLTKQGITPISEGPVTIPEWNEPAAGIKAFYFRSPENHPLELIYFPPKKGRTLWQEKDRLFLGIDHTALTVYHTDQSLSFYRDLLGMQVFGESLNHGPTQEALSGVAGAKVRITGLGFPKAEAMGVEFLHYLHPDGGKPTPALQGNDLGCTYTVIQVVDPKKWEKLAQSSGKFTPRTPKEIRAAYVTQDPDLHRVLIVGV